MGKKLKVYRQEDGTPAVKCPRCDDFITPEKQQNLFDGFDCPSCGQIIEEEDLSNYFKVLSQWEDEY